jgi:hypothetical protein
LSTPDLADSAVHVALVSLSVIVLVVSILAYLKRRTRRYIFLTLAFGFLTLGQAVDLVETIFMSNQLIEIPIVQIHLSHMFEFLMLFSFCLALLAK